MKPDCSRKSWYSFSVLKFCSLVVLELLLHLAVGGLDTLLLGLAHDPGVVEDVVQGLVAEGLVLGVVGAGPLAVLRHALTGRGLAQRAIEVLLRDLVPSTTATASSEGLSSPKPLVAAISTTRSTSTAPSTIATVLLFPLNLLTGAAV